MFTKTIIILLPSRYVLTIFKSSELRYCMKFYLNVKYSKDWNNSTQYVYFLQFFPTLRSLFQTVRLLDLSPEIQNAFLGKQKAS